MSNLHLTIASGDYDHTRDLMSGRVRAEGIDITPIHVPVEEMFFRFTKFQEWDVSELSFAKTISILSQPDPWLVPIPVFPSRAFRHSSIYVRADRKIEKVTDLAGKKVGLPEWAQTAAIYSRGLLAHDFGVDLSSIDWYQAGVNDAGRKEKVALKLPHNIRLTPRPDASLSSMLLDGSLDAVLSARPPNAFLQQPDVVKRLIPDYRTAEADYWSRTGIFPIMHVMAIKRTVFEQNPWIATNLLHGFEAAKERSVERAKDITASSFPLPWISDYAAQSEQIMGPDIWPYGIEHNHKTLSAFTQYAFEQGVTHRKMEVEELFPLQVQAKVKV